MPGETLGGSNGIHRSGWCGLTPYLPDGLPVVSPVPSYPGLLLATGHSMTGLTLGPVTGALGMRPGGNDWRTCFLLRWKLMSPINASQAVGVELMADSVNRRGTNGTDRKGSDVFDEASPCKPRLFADVPSTGRSVGTCQDDLAGQEHVH